MRYCDYCWDERSDCHLQIVPNEGGDAFDVRLCDECFEEHVTRAGLERFNTEIDAAWPVVRWSDVMAHAHPSFVTMLVRMLPESITGAE